MLIDLVTQYNMKMTLPEDILTLQALATGNMTHVDNVFCSNTLLDHLVTCITKPEDRLAKADHFPNSTYICHPTP